MNLPARMKPTAAEARLAAGLDPRRLPRHVAFIMDGNGRWARRRGLPRIAGHRKGAETVRTVLRTSVDLGIEYVTLYAFSAENWARPRAEVAALWRLLRRYLRSEVEELDREGTRLLAIGRLDALPRFARDELNRTIERLAHHRRSTLILALNYGGRAEIADAARALARDAVAGRIDPGAIDEEAVAARLYTAGIPDPDLLIRTSGEMRISNFLPWQIAYTEIYVTERYWPDFGRRDYLEALLAYQGRERRFGGVEAAPPRAGAVSR